MQFLLRTQIVVWYSTFRCGTYVCKELLQLHRHHQHWAYTQAPNARTSGKFANLEKLPSPWSGYRRRENPDLCIALPFNASRSRRALNSLLLVSSDALTPLVCYICDHAHAISTLCKRIVQSQDWHTVSGLWECAAQSRDCTNSRLREHIYSKSV